MRDLTERVHAGIGAPSAAYARRLSAELEQSGFERTLHGGTLSLALPAEKRRAVVFDEDAVAGHEGS